MLQDSAMLANLQIRAWTARKLDKTVTAEVDAAHQAHDAGRFNKLLIDKAALDPFTKLTSKIRDFHYRQTLPWGDNGDRLLPATQYLAYTAQLRSLRAEADAAVATFVAAYPSLVAAARARLGTLYDARDYPAASDIASRFAVGVELLPVPDAHDFRVELAEGEAERVRAQIMDTVQARQAGAARECWRRLHEVLTNLATTMAKDKPVFRDSLVGNVAELVELLPRLNVMDDAALNDLCADIQRWLAGGVTPFELRKHPRLRADTLAMANTYLALIAPRLAEE